MDWNAVLLHCMRPFACNVVFVWGLNKNSTLQWRFDSDKDFPCWPFITRQCDAFVRLTRKCCPLHWTFKFSFSSAINLDFICINTFFINAVGKTQLYNVRHLVLYFVIWYFYRQIILDSMDGFNFALIKKKTLNIYHTYPLMYCKVTSELLKKEKEK